MNAVPFDTLKFARRLEAAGLLPPVAAGMSEALAEAMSSSNLATKGDIGEVRQEIAELRRDLGILRSDMAQESESVRSDMAREFASVRSDMAREFASVRSDMAREFGSVRHDMAQEFASVRSEVKSQLELLRRDMTIKLGSMIFIAVGVLLAAMRLMPHP